MRKVLTINFIRAIIITLFAALLIAGGVYAYETLWSGKAHITVETPTGGGQVEITSIHADRGTWNESTGTWTVSIPRGGDAALHFTAENTGGDAVTVACHVLYENPAYQPLVAGGIAVGNGVTIVPDSRIVPSGESRGLGFLILVSVDAEPGELPKIPLEIRVE